MISSFRLMKCHAPERPPSGGGAPARKKTITLARSALRHLSFSETHIGPLTCRRWSDLFARYYNWTIEDRGNAEFRACFAGLRSIFTFQHDRGLSREEKQARYAMVRQFFYRFPAFAAAEEGLDRAELKVPALMFCLIKNLHYNSEHAEQRGLPAHESALVIKALITDINRILAEFTEKYKLDYVIVVK